MTETGVFKHSTPDLYDRYMGPLLFEPYARHVAERVTPLRPSQILETAAGTGIVTRAVAAVFPAAEIVATDINPLSLSSQRSTSGRNESSSSAPMRRICPTRTNRSISSCVSSG